MMGIPRKHTGQAETTGGPLLSFNFIWIGSKVYSEMIGRKK